MEWAIFESRFFMFFSCLSVIAVVFNERNIVEVALVGCANPYNLGSIRQKKVGAIDPKEDKSGVDEVFHKDDAHLVLSNEVIVGFSLSLTDHLFQFFCIFTLHSHWCPVFGDGGHEAVGIAVVMVNGVVVLRRPDDDVLLARHELIVAALCGRDAKERQEVVISGEDLTFL